MGRERIVRAVVAGTAVAALFAAAACNDDADDASTKTTTTTTAVTTTSITVPTPTGLIEITTTTADPTQFGQTIGSVQGDLAAAGDDLCKIAAATSDLEQAGAPTTTADIQALLTVYGDVFNKIADALPDESADDAEVIRDAVTEMLAKGAASDYDPNSFTETGPAGLFDNPAMATTMERVGKKIADECPGIGPGDAPTTTEG